MSSYRPLSLRVLTLPLLYLLYSGSGFPLHNDHVCASHARSFHLSVFLSSFLSPVVVHHFTTQTFDLIRILRYKWSSTRQRVEHKICRYCFINAHEQPFRLVGEHENEVRHMDFHPDFPHGMPDPKHEEEMPEYATQSEVHGILDMDFDFGLYLKYTLNLNMLEYLEVDWKSWMAMVGTCAVFWIVSIIKVGREREEREDERGVLCVCVCVRARAFV